MPFDTPTLDDQIAFTVAHYATLFPDDDLSALSFNFLWCVCLAAAVTDNHANINAARNDVMPDTSEGNELDRWAKIRGVTRKSATGARKAKALRVVGVATTAVPALTELTDEATGLRFRITAAAVVGAGTPGTVDVDIAAIDTGSQTRLSKGAILRFTTPIAGLEELAELQLNLDEDGTDAELDGALRLRVLSRFSTPPLGGQATDYEQWALEVAGWADAYCYPIRAGLGTVDLVALHEGSGTARIPLDAEVDALQPLIDAKRPVSVRQSRVLYVDAQTQNVEATVTPNGAVQFARDWDDSAAPTVSSWNAGTRVLKFAGGSRPESLKAGDRLSFSTGATGAQRVVEVLGPGVDEVTLEADAAGDTPVAAAVVYAGGPLVEPARQAIKDLFDSLGTANPDAKRYGTWEGNLDPAAVREAARVEGALRSACITPTSLVEATDPAFPDDDRISLLVYGRIIVRYA